LLNIAYIAVYTVVWSLLVCVDKLIGDESARVGVCDRKLCFLSKNCTLFSVQGSVLKVLFHLDAAGMQWKKGPKLRISRIF
jgi:hypothetical protein